MEEEGIFRIPPSGVDIRALKSHFEVEWRHLPTDSKVSIHSVAGLLKLYLRELPDPIITKELFDCFLAASGLI
jgi:hypothetical protein